MTVRHFSAAPWKRLLCTVYLAAIVASVPYLPLAVAETKIHDSRVDWIGFWVMVDSRWPPPDLSELGPVVAFSEFRAPNLLLMEDGSEVRVVGLSCTREGAVNVSRLIEGQHVRLAVPRAAVDGIISASDVYRLDFDPFNRAVFDSPVVSRPLETAIINRWCRLRITEENTLHLAERVKFVQRAAECLELHGAEAAACLTLMKEVGEGK